MNLFERVQKLIKEKGLTVKQVERDCGLANATIRRWETQTPNIESVNKVAQTLHVSIDYLVNGSSLNATTTRPLCDGEPLSEAEADLVAMYRLISAEDRKTIFDLTTLKDEQSTGERGSVYSTYTDTNEPPKNGSNGEPKSHHEAV